MHVFVYVQMSKDTCGGQKGVLNYPELESEIVVSCRTWVLGLKLGSPVKAVYALNCRAISPPHSPSLHPQSPSFNTFLP